MPPPMIATRATSPIPSRRDEARRRRAPATLGALRVLGALGVWPRRAVLLAAVLAACGGRSVHTADGLDADEPSEGDSGQEPAGSGGNLALGGNDGDVAAADLATCRHVCLTCAIGTEANCATLCGDVYDNASAAGCTEAVSRLLDCKKRVDDCGYGACPTENNALSVCVIEYCTGPHTLDPLCIAPI